MKKRIPLVWRVASLPAGCLIAVLLLTGMETTSPRIPPGPVKKDYHVKATIPAAQLGAAFKRARRKELAIFLYVVKSSPEKNNKDVHLLWCAVDSGRKPVFAEKSWTDESLAKQSGWYVHFLRLNGVAQQDVVMGYHVSVDPQTLAHISGLSVEIFPFQAQKNRILLNHSSSLPLPRPMLFSDSCKIPPGCGGFGPPFPAPMNEIMSKEYSTH